MRCFFLQVVGWREKSKRGYNRCMTWWSEIFTLSSSFAQGCLRILYIILWISCSFCVHYATSSSVFASIFADSEKFTRMQEFVWESASCQWASQIKSSKCCHIIVGEFCSHTSSLTPFCFPVICCWKSGHWIVNLALKTESKAAEWLLNHVRVIFTLSYL